MTDPTSFTIPIPTHQTPREDPFLQSSPRMWMNNHFFTPLSNTIDSLGELFRKTIAALSQVLQIIYNTIPRPFSSEPWQQYTSVHVSTTSRTDLGGGINNGGNTCYLASLIQVLNLIKESWPTNEESVLIQNRETKSAQKKIKELLNLNKQELEADIEDLAVEYLKEKYKIEEKVYETEIAAKGKDNLIKQVIDRCKLENNQRIIEIKIKEELEQIFEKINKNEKLNSEEINSFRQTICERLTLFDAERQEDPHELCMNFSEFFDFPKMQFLNKVHYKLPVAENDEQKKRWESEEAFKDHNRKFEISYCQLSIEPPYKEGLSIDKLFTHEELTTNETILRALPKEKESTGILPKGTITEEIVRFNKNAPLFLPLLLKRFTLYNRIGLEIQPSETLKVEIVQSEDPEIITYAEYELIASVVHQGKDRESGHYIAYVKKQIDGETRWVQYNDGNVGLCEKNEQAIEDMAHNGYLFFYKRKEIKKDL